METAGEHLRATLLRLHMNQVELSVRLGISRQSVNNIINGRQAISRPVARKLAAITQRPTDYWLRDKFLPLGSLNHPGTEPDPDNLTFPEFILQANGGLAGELKTHRNLPALTSWPALRAHVKSIYAGSEMVTHAKMLWQSYEQRRNGSMNRQRR